MSSIKSPEFQSLLTKYNASAKICREVYQKLEAMINAVDQVSVKEMYAAGNEMIQTACQLIYKREQKKELHFLLAFL
jgi:methionine aminopeptidase